MSNSTITAILVGNTVVSSQENYLSNTQLENVTVVTLSSLSENSELANICKGVKDNSFAIVIDNKMVDYKNNISTKFNWIEVFGQFSTNYKDNKLEDGFYKWGQIVPETAEYLCKDCGYIAEFEAGTVFPICEVCQAGEPDGPSTPSQGYWEQI